MQRPITRDPVGGVARWAERAVLAAAALYLLAFVVCVSLRLTFGFETTWMESGLLAMTVARAGDLEAARAGAVGFRQRFPRGVFLHLVDEALAGR